MMKRRAIRVLCILAVCAGLVWLLALGYRRYRHHVGTELCAACLHEIGYAVLLYSNDHGGQWPDSLATVMRAGRLDPRACVCLDSDDTPAPGADSTAQATSLMSGGHLSYVYIGGGLVNPVLDDQHTVIAYEREIFHGHMGLNVMFADGHIELLPPATAKQFLIMARTTTRPTRWPPGATSEPNGGDK